MKLKNVVYLAITVAALLVVPLIAMRFTDEVVWTGSDFVFAGVVLFGAGIVYQFISSKVGGGMKKAATGLAVFSTLLMVWVNAAVGLISDQNDMLNIMCLSVPVVGLVGAGVARFRSRGLSNALFVMAIIQMLVPLIAFVSADDLKDTWRLFGANGFFAFWFVVSGLLFRRANAANPDTRVS